MLRRKQETLCGLRPRANASIVMHEPFVIKFTYPCGYQKDVMVAKDKNLKRIAKALLVRFAGEKGYWSKVGGGVSDECPRCRRAALKAKREGR